MGVVTRPPRRQVTLISTETSSVQATRRMEATSALPSMTCWTGQSHLSVSLPYSPHIKSITPVYDLALTWCFHSPRVPWSSGQAVLQQGRQDKEEGQAEGNLMPLIDNRPASLSTSLADCVSCGLQSSAKDKGAKKGEGLTRQDSSFNIGTSHTTSYTQRPVKPINACPLIAAWQTRTTRST